MESFDLPKNLLMGVATAATHIEGGVQNHNWYRWSEQGKIADGSHVKRACDHVNRISSDVDLIAGLHCETYRMGLEWSRIEPEEGQFSNEGIAVYKHELKLLLEKKITPLVTLWHFSNPLWMEDDGGWTNPKSVDRFLNYLNVVLRELGDLVTDWVTINEPNVYLFFAYFEGQWPPGKKGDIRSFFKGARNLILAHLRAYDHIHDYYSRKATNPKVGVAHHLRIFDAADDINLTRWSVRLTKHIFQDMFLEAMTKGVFRWPLRGSRKIKTSGYADFMGINYYSRDLIKGNWNPTQLFGERIVKQNTPVNELGWEIYPEGISRLCGEAYQKYRLPIYITENGVCDSNDKLRSLFIYDHLRRLKQVSDAGVDIQRYYHWSLMDNFEWAEGESARFGLYHVDYETQKRTMRPSGSYFREINATRKVFNPNKDNS